MISLRFSLIYSWKKVIFIVSSFEKTKKKKQKKKKHPVNSSTVYADRTAFFEGFTPWQVRKYIRFEIWRRFATQNIAQMVKNKPCFLNL